MSAIAAGIVGLVGFGFKQSANQQRFENKLEELNFAAEMNRFNENVAKSDIKFIQGQVDENVKRIGVIGRKFIGNQRAGFSASGITLSGSALDVLRETNSLVSLAKTDVFEKGQRQQRVIGRELARARITGRRIERAKRGAVSAFGTESVANVLGLFKGFGDIAAGGGRGGAV